MRFINGYDFRIIIPTIFLLGISLVILSSLEIDFFRNQLFFTILGMALFVVMSSVNIHSLRRLSFAFYAGSVLLLVLLFVVGIEIRGASRWLEVAGIRIQFSEIIKPFLIVSSASFLSSWDRKVTLKRLVVIFVLFFPVAFFLYRQPDLGNVLVYGATFMFMLLGTGISLWYLVGGFLALAVSFPLLWNVLADYQRNRILTFINPKHDPLGIGYNAIQSAIAVGSGLLFGRGLGRGVQSQLAFLPERHTDFIFATFAEQFGFVGSIVVLALYFFLLLRMLQIARDLQNSFEAIVVLGAFALILTQTFINIGMNVGIVPITGVTLPLFSYGGSSLISTMILLGLVNSISRGMQQKQDTLEIR